MDTATQKENAMTIDERRALLRTAMKSSDPADISGFTAAIEGTDEDERASLARTLPPSQLFWDEGPTPRACFVLAALGKPEIVAETLPNQVYNRRRLAEFRTWAGQNTNAASLGILGRDDTWCYQFIDDTSGHGFAPESWAMTHELITERSLTPDSEIYLVGFIDYISKVNEPELSRANEPELSEMQAYRRLWDSLVPRTARQIVDLLCSNERFLHQDFWAIYRVETLGAQYRWCNNEIWDEALLILCDEIPGFRSRLVDESLQALLRDFSPGNVIWYHRVHRLLDPTPDEVVPRIGTYLAVLGTTPSTSVGLAQDMSKKVITDIDAVALIDASKTVLRRSEKKLVKTQIDLLRATAKAHPSAVDLVAGLVTSVLDDLPTDMAAYARRLIPSEHVASRSVANATITEMEQPVVPPPRTQSLPPTTIDVPPITDESALWTLVIECLEGTGNGADLPRMLSYLHTHPDLTTSQQILKQARKIVRRLCGDYPETNPNVSSPRFRVAALLLARIGERNRFTPKPTNTPTELLAEQIALVGNTVASKEEWGPSRAFFNLNSAPKNSDNSEQEPTEAILITTPLPAVSPHWERTTDGYWLNPHEPSPEQWTWPSLIKRAYDVSCIPAESFQRQEDACWLDGHDHVVEWAVWLYTHNPDILAAQFHPALEVATYEVYVRGIVPLLAGLGASYRLPGRPVYSALAIGLTAKLVGHRAAAAEAVSSLAERGLLVPELFAAEITAHLRGGLMAGRLASALADTASISPITGYRVLQTLSAVLPHLDGVNQAARLVELTAKLAADYGTPVPIPESLAGKTKGSSLMAVSLRLLADVRQAPTALLQAAAEQAAASLEQ